MSIIYGIDVRYVTNEHLCENRNCQRRGPGLWVRGRLVCSEHAYEAIFVKESFAFFAASKWLVEDTDRWLRGKVSAYVLPVEWAGSLRDIDAVEAAALAVEPLTGRCVIKDTAGERFCFDAQDTAFNVPGVLTTDGCVVAVDRVPVCYNYFGGPNTIVNGLLTVGWPPSGVLTWTNTP